MINRPIKNSILRKIALTMAVILLVETILPSVALALTSGPSQPEFQGFQQVGTNDMVNLFTGDFNYNIPLCEIGGYPLNIAYNANPGMDDEASWVGLGWTLNPGSINRQMNGLPDDFKGDKLTKEFSLAADTTIGLTFGAGVEVFGFGGALNKGLTYNSRRGFEISTGLNFDAAIAVGKNSVTYANLGLNFSPSAGLNIAVSAGLGFEIGQNISNQNSLSQGFNSRKGLTTLTFQNQNSIRPPIISLPAGIGGSYSFFNGPFTYTPTAALPISTDATIYRGKIGVETPIGAFVNVNIEGFTSKQSLAANIEEQATFGYLHLEEGNKDSKAHLDYNSELNGQFKENTPHIPLAYGTPDVFSIAGHGIGGQFKACRNDVGIFRPAQELNNSVNTSFGVETPTPGAFIHAGLNPTTSTITTSKQGWNKTENNLSTKLAFTSNGLLNPAYEAVYFKPIGEQSLLDETASDLFPAVAGTTPTRMENIRLGMSLTASTNLIVEKEGKKTTMPISNLVNNTKRVKRNQVIAHLNGEEASKVGLDKKILNYPYNNSCAHHILLEDGANCSLLATDFIERDTGNRATHHLSELSITNANGGRYVYGLPVYNNKRRDVTFSVDENNLIANQTKVVGTDNYGLVSYAAGQDNSINNQKGKEQYYDVTQLPPYAHSFLLTGVLSPDYVDRLGDGITDDDSGNAVKFNYHRHSDSYKWRIPSPLNKASYHEGLKSTTADDKASYVYGEKEIWYPYSIESRTMVARFYTSERVDGLGVVDENGQPTASQNLLKLDSIAVFSKSDLLTQKEAAIPIKNIHFEYDYSLCPSVPNNLDGIDPRGFENQGGKLTLKKIYFTYGKNRSGKLNAYHFNYNTGADSVNGVFEYNIGHYDRWGYFKKNPSNYPPNYEYPYVLQSENHTKDVAGAWNLNEIVLPSGSRMEVAYEPDDYAYVQDKRAGQMMKVLGFVTNPNSLTAPISLDFNLFEKNQVNFTNKKYVAVEIPLDLTIVPIAKKLYLEGVESVYFDFLVQLKKGDDNSYERVKGYFTLDDSPTNPVKIKTTDMGKNCLLIPFKYLKDQKGNDINPITFAAIQKTRIERPELIYPGFNTNGPIEGVFKSFVGLAQEIGNLTRGFVNNAMRKGFGQVVSNVENNSWIRLCNPAFKKLGGGTRVKTITINDQWAKGAGSAIYGQSYHYDMPLTINGVEKMISSGVACYEPGIGEEENMLRTPLPYEEKYRLAPKNIYYSENPIGGALFPAPVVGYSSVRVTDIANQRTALIKNKTGQTIHQFYTAKDFPSLVDKTEIEPVPAKSKPLRTFFKFGAYDAKSVSQGFTIELNDMHGKPKSQSIYDKNAALLSSTTYHYKEEQAGASRRKLTNDVLVLKNTGTIAEAKMGINMDTWVEMLEENNETKTPGKAYNVDVIPLGFIPIPIPFPTVFQINKYENTQFRAATMTKLIQRTGILDSVVVMENGSTITTSNELFDEETGNVLLTKTQNEFDDAMYNFNYPAHWAYDRMGQAYRNINQAITFTNTDGSYIPDDKKEFFNIGDEVLLITDGVINPKKYLIDTFNVVRFALYDEDCNRPAIKDKEVVVKVIRSGKRNLLETSVGSLTTRKTLATDTNNDEIVDKIIIDDSRQVLAATATTFNDFWKTQCYTEPIPTKDNFVETFIVAWNHHPVSEGRKGNWRAHENYVFYGERNTATFGDNMHIQDKGLIASFTPFWAENNGLWTPQMQLDNKWTRTGSVTSYDFRGNELESIDALQIPSAALYGYHRNLVTAVANNAQYQEIAFDGFEDYNYKTEYSAEAARTSTAKKIAFRRNIDFYPKAAQNGASVAFTSLEDGIAHTGKHALIAYPYSDAVPYYNKINYVCTTSGSETGFAPEFKVNPCEDCQPILDPTPGKDYAISIWLATDKSLKWGEQPKGYGLQVAFLNSNGATISSTILQTKPTAPIIEGWQQIEEKITIHNDAQYLKIAFVNTDNEATPQAYFDDFRFHPWEASNMQSYVYDPISERLMATLDENNYASFYEYNDEGILIRTKRETEKGIITIQEGRTVLRPNN